MKWVSMDERLPETPGEYLTYSDTAGNGFYRRRVCWFAKSGSWYWAGGISAIVTHWMPLPAPPEVQE
jgi:hypothetical protein